MASDPAPREQAECYNCGFEAAVGSDDWETADLPTLGTTTQCPGCGSTDVHTL